MGKSRFQAGGPKAECQERAKLCASLSGVSFLLGVRCVCVWGGGVMSLNHTIKFHPGAEISRGVRIASTMFLIFNS